MTNPFANSGSNPFANSGSNPFANSGSNPFTNTGATSNTSTSNTNQNSTTQNSANKYGNFNYSWNMNKTPQKKEYPNVTIPEEIKTKTVKALLDSMEQKLENQSKAFQNQAQQIAKWDKMLFDCIDIVCHLQEQIERTNAEQQELLKNAKSILSDQEVFIDQMKYKHIKTSRISAPEDQRDRIYKLAQQLGNQFSDMETQIKEMVDRIEKGQHLSEFSSDMDKISKITNCHLNSLQWMENQNKKLDQKIKSLSEKLKIHPK